MPSWEGKSRGGSFGHRFFIFLIRTFGVRFAYFFLLFVVVHFIPFAPLATKSNWHYFRKIKRYGIAKTVMYLYLNYYRFGQVIIDKVAIRSGLEKQYNYEFEQYDEFLRLLNGNTGVIIIGAHIGNWEIGSSFFGDYQGTLNMVMYDAEYREIKEVLEHTLKETNYRVIPIADNSLEHIYQIKTALDNRECICFQGDRFISDKSSVVVDFLGCPAKFPLGPFLLSSKYRVPVVFYFSMREKGMTYRFKFCVADTSRKENGERPEHLLLKQYVNALEETINQYPEQWFNYYNFWNV